jgi:hypothetical protein
VPEGSGAVSACVTAQALGGAVRPLRNPKGKDALVQQRLRRVHAHTRRLMPATPCHQFYMAKLRNQEWIRNDFSDVFVALSDCHSMLRQDDSGKKNEDTKQDFVRNTKKYWVPTEHGTPCLSV